MFSVNHAIEVFPAFYLFYGHCCVKSIIQSMFCCANKSTFLSGKRWFLRIDRNSANFLVLMTTKNPYFSFLKIQFKAQLR